MSVSKEEVLHIANLSKLYIEDEKIEKYTNELSNMVDLANSLELFNDQLDKLKEDRESKCNIIQDLQKKYWELDSNERKVFYLEKRDKFKRYNNRKCEKFKFIRTFWRI